MSTEVILKETQERFTKTIENFLTSTAGINIKANSSFFNAIKMEVYGSQTPITQVASINVVDSKTLMVRVHDSNNAGAVNKAIQSANLGVTCILEGSSLRVTMPPISEERRKSMAGLVTKTLEDAKIAIRNIRRDKVDQLKRLNKAKEISDDQTKKSEDAIQKATDHSIKQLEVMSSSKIQEILKI